MLTTTVTYRTIATNMASSLARTATLPTVEHATAYYLENIGDVRSIDDFLADHRLYSYAMEAFGLGEMTYAKAFMRKILEEGADDSASLANRLADERYRAFAETFDFARYGEATTSFDRTQQGTVDRYVRQTLEEDAGEQNEGVRLALYFERKVPGIDSAMDILADPALLQVVQTALGLSPLTAAASVDRQAEMISERLDVADLQDPEKLESFMMRFTSFWDLGHADAIAPAAILLGQTQPFGLSPDLLLSLQRLRLGGI